MQALNAVFFGVLGACFGSFLNVVIDRLPAGRSLVRPASHCDSCLRHLSAVDLVPVLSYIVQRGRCRYCHARIPLRVLWVEVLGALLLAVSYYYYGMSLTFVLVATYGCLFLVLAVIDLEHTLILNRVVYPSLIAALIIDVFVDPPGIVRGLIGGIAGFAVLMVIHVISPGGMALGDVKMAALIGAVTGFPNVVVALFIGIVLGGVTAGFLLLSRLKKRKEFIPFGPFLSAGTLAALVWGKDILDWYLGSLGR